MSNGFFTILLLQLSVDYWYFVLIALLIKFFLIRFMVAESLLKTTAMWTTATFVFYAFVSLGGYIFSSANIYTIPFLMFALGLTIETILCSMIFQVEAKKVFIPLAIGEFLLFFLLFSQINF